jgi:hypothetical protein
LFLPVSAYTLSSTKLEIRAKYFLPGSEVLEGVRDGAGGVREGKGEVREGAGISGEK